MICRNVQRTLAIATLVLTIASAGCRREGPRAQPEYPQTTYLVREGNSDDQKFRYRVYVPPRLKPGERAPVMLYLHGAGNRGEDNQSQLNGLADVIDQNRDKFNFIVVIPQCPTDRFWDEEMIGRATKALDDTVSEFHADSDRLYLAGFSLGGYGVWSVAATFPQKFAALIPMSGRILPRPSEIKNVSPEIAALTKASDPYGAFAEKIGKTPVWIFHGSNDGLVPVANSRKMIEALKSSGNDRARYTEVTGAGHEPLGFRDPELFVWLGEQRNDK